MKIFESFKTIAKTIAEERFASINFRTCHIAFIFKKNKIIEIGVNSPKTHSWNARFNYHSQKTATCAELIAVIKSTKNKICLSDKSIAILRVDRNGQICNSRPCAGCQDLLSAFNFDKVWHSDDSGNIISFN